MVTYLLLRDNKEQGPMRLEDLLEIGLKPYDLVWLPGKSAAWRYPSEIEELKAYASAVEEQPFDRFYKKENTEATAPAVPQKHNTTINDTFTKSKMVAVTMPTVQKKVVVKTVVETSQQTSTPAYEQYQAYMPAAEKKLPTKQKDDFTDFTKEKEAAAIAAYSEKYEQAYLNRKKKFGSRAVLIKYGSVAAIIIVLLGVGIVLGVNVNKQGTPEEVVIPINPENIALADVPEQETTEEVTTEQIHEPAIETPAEENVKPAAVPQKAPLTLKEKIPAVPPVAVKKVDQSPDLSKPVTDKKTLNLSRDNKAKAVFDKPSVVTATDTKDAYAYETYTTENNGERRGKVRDNESVKTVGSNNKSSKSADKNSNPFYVAPTETPVKSNEVKIVANDYKVVPFGGIRNLQLTVQNRSDETLEQVIVDVEYIKADKKVFKTKTVEFKNVGPKSSAIIKVDDTNRGVDVAYHIRKVVK